MVGSVVVQITAGKEMPAMTAKQASGLEQTDESHTVARRDR
jgi:hypothetical protein